MTDAHIQDTIRRIYNLRNRLDRVVDRQVLSGLARELAKALKDEEAKSDR